MENVLTLIGDLRNTKSLNNIIYCLSIYAAKSENPIIDMIIYCTEPYIAKIADSQFADLKSAITNYYICTVNYGEAEVLAAVLLVILDTKRARYYYAKCKSSYYYYTFNIAIRYGAAAIREVLLFRNILIGGNRCIYCSNGKNYNGEKKVQFVVSCIMQSSTIVPWDALLKNENLQILEFLKKILNI